MSDFLGRMAARAVGEAPLAQPRLPALFDPGTPALAVVDRESVVRATTPEQPDAAAPPAHGAIEVAESVENTRRSNPPVTTDRLESPRLVRGTRSLTPALTMLDAEREGPRRERTTNAVPDSAASALEDGDLDRVTAAAVPAIPAPREAVVHGAAAPVPATTAHDEPPAVRVHIGRLEVRANLQDAAPPPPQPRPADSRPQGLSLSDYLRGKREAG